MKKKKHLQKTNLRPWREVGKIGEERGELQRTCNKMFLT